MPPEQKLSCDTRAPAGGQLRWNWSTGVGDSNEVDVAQGLIYMVDADGSLRRMTPSAPENEDKMQALVAKYPELITDGDGDLLLIRREQSIADGEGGDGRWSLDHLFVTRDAIPVLVELKRAADTRLRREVVGQMLDYAANATAYWQSGRIAEGFSATVTEAGRDPDAVLGEFIGEQEPEMFWGQVDANFKAGRIKLVFVADEIPRELARVVEFLNDQMRADVRAVELRWFAGDSGVITLSPRVIGETERAAAAKIASPKLEPISVEQWLEKYIRPLGEEAMQGSAAYLNMLDRLGGAVELGAKQGSIYGRFTGTDGKPFYPFHLWRAGTLSLSLLWLQARPALREEAARKQLLESLVEVVGAMSTTNLTGFPAFKVAILANPSIASRVEAWLKDALAQMR